VHAPPMAPPPDLPAREQQADRGHRVQRHPGRHHPFEEPLPCLRVRGQHGRSQDGVAREVIGRDAPREHVAERAKRLRGAAGARERSEEGVNDVNVVEREGGIRRG
jgi:hypothetical protein